MTRPLRIAVANWTDRLAGGTETYLANLIPRLRELGHEVMLLHETSEPDGRRSFELSPEARFDVTGLGIAEALNRIREWRPDVLLQNGLRDVALEASLLEVAPAVLLAHSYYGTCISGTKTWQSVRRPCTRVLGAGCLAHYYPHRCGGLNPLTMARLYGLQMRRKDLLAQYRLVLTLSAHMRSEYERHGVRAEWAPLVSREPAQPRSPRTAGSPWRLLFVGRMQLLKGGDLLIEAAGRLRGRVSAPLSLTFVGDGPDRIRWERQAKKLQSEDLRVRFTGWLTGDALREEWGAADLFVLPAVWPEPLGLVGAEASEYRIPTVAFANGGIPEWLEDGGNGVIAAPPTSAASLAEAIVRAIGSEQAYESLAASTAERAIRADYGRHAVRVSEILVAAAGGEGE